VPRLCPQLHGDAIIHHRTFAVPALGLGPDDVVHSVSKLSFAYGLGNSLLYPLMSGSLVVLNPNPPQVEDVLAIVAKHEVTSLFAVPTFYSELVAHPDRDRLLNGIGSTEAGRAFTHNTPGARRVGTVGRALPPFEVRVVDDRGDHVEPDVVGRLEVRGPTITVGVGEDGRAVRTQDWYATGDLASIDADAFIRVTGRLDDIENVGGVKVHPLEVEHLLGSHPLVREVAACAVARIVARLPVYAERGGVRRNGDLLRHPALSFGNDGR
jgi:fatty acid CoA ligase FadD22